MNMHYRIAQYHIKDLIHGYEEVSRSLNETCCRDGKFYRLSGVFQSREYVIFSLEDGVEQPGEYVIVPLSGEEPADIVGEIEARWQGNFSARGQIVLAEQYLGVFEKVK